MENDSNMIMHEKDLSKKILVYCFEKSKISIILKWLRNNYACEIVSSYIDFEQNDKAEIEINKLQKELEIETVKFYLVDTKKDFITDYIYPAVKANALYKDENYINIAISMIAEKVINIAHKINAKIICHNFANGNKKIFELMLKNIDPSITIISPYIGNNNNQFFSDKKNIIEKQCNYKSIYENSMIFKKKINDLSIISLSFYRGIPVAINERKYLPMQLITKLDKIAYLNGIKKSKLIEEKVVETESIYIHCKSPAIKILNLAHKELESISIDKETIDFKQLVSFKYAEIIQNGLWFSTLKEALDAFVNSTQKYVTGTVMLKFYNGNIIPISKKSKYSLQYEYSENLNTFYRNNNRFIKFCCDIPNVKVKK
ncbi:MAG: argininosuccinate synthase [Endomicrobium sp.]|jgi:argininosuccinate synthase|nr:argininosuccinate synthase [Endomicrobium sp.]